MVVVGILKGNMISNVEHEVLANQCKRLINLQDWEILISHCYRETNSVADGLANLGVRLGIGFCFFESPPNEVLNLLFADNVRVAWPIVINN